MFPKLLVIYIKLIIKSLKFFPKWPGPQWKMIYSWGGRRITENANTNYKKFQKFRTQIEANFKKSFQGKIYGILKEVRTNFWNILMEITWNFQLSFETTFMSDQWRSQDYFRGGNKMKNSWLVTKKKK